MSDQHLCPDLGENNLGKTCFVSLKITSNKIFRDFVGRRLFKLLLSLNCFMGGDLSVCVGYKGH